ncbi:Bacterioferritin-associated ferredoxin [Tistlia consotensis]|uniref:Bacterioferritin-associated ferredoxin n=1 Tax=Tistlia consotensis USBA 355 TaxID=560819 RepID=A0A1Y6BQZ3_9PROT|nr:(2Fe-2S)-binding protein [Tistlia consotensis]SMF23515.1 Bacterioferritin-associated ferredoxin [Tistlia consotensis USBA 355]SNR61530.1 Bacterioferritin-associated ferredoxin [Tistlia consotensis]
MYVCLCSGMNCRQVKQALSEGARSHAQVFLRNGLRPSCGRCRDTIVGMIDEHAAQAGANDGAPAALDPLSVAAE